MARRWLPSQVWIGRVLLAAWVGLVVVICRSYWVSDRFTWTGVAIVPRQATAHELLVRRTTLILAWRNGQIDLTRATDLGLPGPDLTPREMEHKRLAWRLPTEFRWDPERHLPSRRWRSELLEFDLRRAFRFRYSSRNANYGPSTNRGPVWLPPTYTSWRLTHMSMQTERHLRVPLWGVLLVLSAWPAAVIARTWWRRWVADRVDRWRHPPGRCRACGYDLRATPDRCPECGARTTTAAAAADDAPAIEPVSTVPSRVS